MILDLLKKGSVSTLGTSCTSLS